MWYILLGIKDYCKDCWHDWLLKRVLAYGGRVYDKCYNLGSKNKPYWGLACLWKEGTVWHYIKQRRIAKKILNQRNQRG